MSTTERPHAPRLTAVMRSEERVMPLELFFDLVFVLALTQCTALMAADPTWSGLATGLLVLGVLWWSWVGYAWLTSVIDPEEGVVRFAIFAAIAALLVASLCVPDTFGDLGLLFAGAYAVVRVAHIVLFWAASRDDPALRSSVSGLAVSTALGVGILMGASFADGAPQGALWALAIVLDMGGPYFFGAEGWKLVPGHFAERHGLIVRWRNVHRFNSPRSLCAVVLVALLPLAVEVPALATLAVVAALLAVLIAYETVQLAELRDRLRHQVSGEQPGYPPTA